MELKDEKTCQSFVLILFVILKSFSLLLPVSVFRLGFTNGLMSESMILWFGSMLIWERENDKKNERSM